MSTFRPLLVGCVISMSGLAQTGPLVEGGNITRVGARAVIAAAEAEGRAKGAPGAVIAVVDSGGHLVAAERIDGTFPAGGLISIGKARTSAIFRKPTRAFEETINKGRIAMVALPDALFTPLQGGVPITVDGKVVGAVGVSGASSAAQDEELALAGAAAVTQAPAASLFSKADVTAAFASGSQLAATPGYQVIASRRDRPGQGEVHDHTDVFHVVAGSATLITGGALVEPQAAGDGEWRGSAIKGGESRPVGPGDVVVIPAGVPHWFQKVSAPITYFTVKVR